MVPQCFLRGGKGEFTSSLGSPPEAQQQAERGANEKVAKRNHDLGPCISKSENPGNHQPQHEEKTKKSAEHELQLT